MRFADIPGHIALKQQLTRAVREGRVSHAQLFQGHPGSAALPLALAYARYVFCTQRTEEDSCGTCPSCIKINNLAHPDLHFSFPTLAKDKEDSASADVAKLWRETLKELPYLDLRFWASQLEDENKVPIIHVKEAASILSRLALKSYEGGYKIMLMWSAESMNTETANKLLKILEEPPEKTLFLLVSFRPDNLLATIVSRTQLIKVLDYQPEDITAYLRERYELNEEQAESTALLAEGNLMEAYRLIHDQEEGDAYLSLFAEWMRKCFKWSPNDIFELADAFAAMGRTQQRAFLQFCLRMFRESILLGYSEGELSRMTDDEGDFLSKFGKYIGGNNIVEILEAMNRAIYHLERNANPKLTFFNLSARMAHYLKLPYSDDVLEQHS